MGAAWEQHLRSLGNRLGISKKVQLFISGHLQVPVMIGFLKPVILLPAAMVNNLSPEQLEAILLHELAHIKRNDYLLNIFQSIVETILFFNPFVWWISRNIRQEREHCCDDLVIAGTVQPMHYAKALVALEEYRITANPMAMAAAHDKHFLLHRIKRIMEMKTKHLNYSQRFLALLIIVTGLVSIAWLNPGGKNGKKEKTRTAVTDTIPPKAPMAPMPPVAAPAEPPVPPAPSVATAPAPPPAPTPFAASQPLPPAPPLAPAALSPAAAPLPPAPPIAPAALSPVAAPLPPMPPVPPGPPNWVSYNGFYYSDTLPAGQKIIIIDDKGNKKEYNSIDEMPAADRKRMEEKFYKMQQAHDRFQYNRSEIDQAMKNAQAAIDKIDWSKMNAQIQAGMKNVDWDKINKQISESMKNIDWDKMNAGIAQQMKDIQWDKISQQIQDKMEGQDWEKINKDIKASLDKIDWKKIENDVRKAMKDIKFDSSFQFNYNPNFNFDFNESRDTSIRRQMEEVRARTREAHARNLAHIREVQEKNVARTRALQEENVARTRQLQEENMARIKEIQARNVALASARQQRNVERIKRLQEEHAARARALQVNEERVQQLREERMADAAAFREKAMKQAEERRAKAEADHKKYRRLLDDMEADKLIDRDAGYNIEKKEGALFINGKKQPDDILKKYEQFLKNDNVTIRGNKNSLNIQSKDKQ
jgi:hypothetical protein